MTPTAIDIPIAERLAKLIRLLGSDKDGEVAAAARAIGRVLDERGVDFHDLAEVVAVGAANGQAGPSRASDDDEYDDDDAPTWAEMVCACSARRGTFNTVECDFIDDLAAMCRQRWRLSPKQDSWLRVLYDRATTRPSRRPGRYRRPR